MIYLYRILLFYSFFYNFAQTKFFGMKLIEYIKKHKESICFYFIIIICFIIMHNEDYLKEKYFSDPKSKKETPEKGLYSNYKKYDSIINEEQELENYSKDQFKKEFKEVFGEEIGLDANMECILFYNSKGKNICSLHYIIDEDDNINPFNYDLKQTKAKYKKLIYKKLSKIDFNKRPIKYLIYKQADLTFTFKGNNTEVSFEIKISSFGLKSKNNLLFC